MKNSIKIRLIVGSLALFTFALGVNVALNSSSVDKLCENSTLAQYRIVGEKLQQVISNDYGSTYVYDQGYEIEKLLFKTNAQLISISEDDIAISESHDSGNNQLISTSIVLPDNSIVTSTNSGLLKRKFSQNQRAIELFLSKSDEETETHLRSNGIYFLKFPINKSASYPEASIVVTIPEKKVQIHKNILIKQELFPLLIIYFGGIILLVWFCSSMKTTDISYQKYSKTRLSIMLFVVVCGAQIVFSTVTTLTFTDQYLTMNKEKARMRVGLLKADLESFLSSNDSMSRFLEGETMLAAILSKSPELNDISIFDNKWHPLYISTKENSLNCQSATTVQIDSIKRTLPEWDPKYNVRLTIDQNDKIQGYISGNISKPVLYDRLIEITLDSITVLVISILFLVEMMIFIFHVVNDKNQKYSFIASVKDKVEHISQTSKKYFSRDKNSPSIGSAESSNVHYGLMRPAAFLLLFGYDLPMSFLPLHTEKLYAPLFGLSKDVIMGLPISVEFFFVGICILVSGIWLDKRGWHEPFVFGLLMAAVGTLYSWGAPDVLNFIISRAITGSGYGLALMASQGFVIEYSDVRSKAQGLAYLFAGIYAGSLCGGATGAMLADRYEYSSVFFTGSVILFGVIAYSFIFMRAGMKAPQKHTAAVESEATPAKKLSRFLSNRIVIALIFFSSLPAAIAVVGFLNYFSPIYLNRIGASQSTIGRILMIYGISLIYIGPLVSKYVDASNKKRLFIFMGCALGSLAFLTFNVVEGLIAAAISMLLLGLSSSFVLASQSAYTLRLKVTEELGAGKSIGIFRSTSRGGQVLGPIVFSWLVLSTNIEQGITYFGIAYLGFAVLFLLLTMKDQQQLAF